MRHFARAEVRVLEQDFPQLPIHSRQRVLGDANGVSAAFLSGPTQDCLAQLVVRSLQDPRRSKQRDLIGGGR